MSLRSTLLSDSVRVGCDAKNMCIFSFGDQEQTLEEGTIGVSGEHGSLLDDVTPSGIVKSHSLTKLGSTKKYSPNL